MMSLFPTLEQALESEGILTDLSADLVDDDFWGDPMREQFAPGSLVRITAPGALFDARYVGALFSAFATSWQGLINVGVAKAEPVAAPPLRKGQQGGQRSQKSPSPWRLAFVRLRTISRTWISWTAIPRSVGSTCRVFQRCKEAYFPPGIHLNMRPAKSERAIVTARLQEGRKYLDSDAEVLFSRYGVGLQEWTLVGSIGHYGHGAAPESPSLINEDDGSVNRADFVEFVNNLLLNMGETGFVDLPRSQVSLWCLLRCTESWVTPTSCLRRNPRDSLLGFVMSGPNPAPIPARPDASVGPKIHVQLRYTISRRISATRSSVYLRSVLRLIDRYDGRSRHGWSDCGLRAREVRAQSEYEAKQV